MKGARTAALTALLQVQENEGYSNLVIDKVIRQASLDPRDAALATTIFYGVLERRIALVSFLLKYAISCVWLCTRSAIWKKFRLRRR